MLTIGYLNQLSGMDIAIHARNNYHINTKGKSKLELLNEIEEKQKENKNKRNYFCA